MPKIDIAKLPVHDSTDYPEPFRGVVAGCARRRLGDAARVDIARQLSPDSIARTIANLIEAGRAA